MYNNCYNEIPDRSFNNKDQGEFGERIVSGELAKLGIKILQPVGENFPFDFVIYHNGKFLKCQVKTGSKGNNKSDYTIRFDITTQRKLDRHIYNSDEVDIFLLCDMKNVFIFSYEELKDVNGITISYGGKPRSNKKYFRNYLLTKERFNIISGIGVSD